jgi:hypothetical protein
MNRAILIKDQNDQLVGELMAASETDILKYLAKGLKVIDKRTTECIQEADVVGTLGVSDGSIIME